MERPVSPTPVSVPVTKSDGSETISFSGRGDDAHLHAARGFVAQGAQREDDLVAGVALQLRSNSIRRLQRDHAAKQRRVFPLPPFGAIDCAELLSSYSITNVVAIEERSQKKLEWPQVNLDGGFSRLLMKKTSQS